MPTSWTIADLRTELERFKIELQGAGLRPASIETYVQRSEVFIRG